jgi:competence protein ComEA
VVDGKARWHSKTVDSPVVFSQVAKPSTSVTRSGVVATTGPHAKATIPLGSIDINTATEKELTTVPGIGHVIAARIIAARPFRSANHLRKVSGIGDKKYAQMRPYFQ